MMQYNIRQGKISQVWSEHFSYLKSLSSLQTSQAIHAWKHLNFNSKRLKGWLIKAKLERRANFVLVVSSVRFRSSLSFSLSLSLSLSLSYSLCGWCMFHVPCSDPPTHFNFLLPYKFCFSLGSSFFFAFFLFLFIKVFATLTSHTRYPAILNEKWIEPCCWWWIWCGILFLPLSLFLLFLLFVERASPTTNYCQVKKTSRKVQ